MYVDIDRILRKQGKTRLWLCQKIGCNYSSLSKLCHNDSTGISFELLEAICVALECGVESILIIGL